MSRANETRRRLLKGALALLAAFWVREVASQPVEVPVRLQAELIAKVAAYDRAFAGRARERASIFVVIKPGDPESERVGEQIRAELTVIEKVGGLPHVEELVRHSSPRALGELCRSRAPAIVYLSSGLGDQMEAIAAALDGVSVLSVAALVSYVPKRAVLGFDIESGKPKLVVHLGQARRQKVAFKPELLALARVIQ